MGHGRAGPYSYASLENLVGCDLHNADHIEPAWQSLGVGDSIALGPTGYPRYAVVEIAPVSHLVLRAGEATGPVRYTWSFVLRPRGASGTRLLVRSRYDFPQIGRAHV